MSSVYQGMSEIAKCRDIVLFLQVDYTEPLNKNRCTDKR